MKKKPTNTTNAASNPTSHSSSTTSNNGNSGNQNGGIGFIPYFFFLSFSMLVTFLFLINNQDFFLQFLHGPPNTGPLTLKPIDPSSSLLSPISLSKATLPTTSNNAIKETPQPKESTSSRTNSDLLLTASTKSPATTATLLSPLKDNSPKNILKISQHCPSSVAKQYQTINESKLLQIKEDTKWCQDKIRFNKVQIGRSWGTLSRTDQRQWDIKKCNEILNLGTIQSCEERYGWKWFEKWLLNKKFIISDASIVQCIQDFKTTSFCKMENIVMDFHQSSVNGGSRSYKKGFLNFYGKGYPENQSFLPVYPGMNFLPGSRPPTNRTRIENGKTIPKECEYVESRPTFILSNDDIYNLGHYINDVMGIWSMLVLANQKSIDSLLINFDGYRYGGPAGGGSHRLMLPNKPDEHGPYSIEYYHKWFHQQVVKAKDYSGRHCFKELYIFPLPGVPWFWNEWGRDDECSFEAASPLYQSFNLFLRQHLLDAYYDHPNTEKRLVFPSEAEYYHIVIEVRSIKRNNANGHSSARFIKNLSDLISALSSISFIHPRTNEKIQVKVTAQDFGKLSFSEQIRLAHTASVFVSMHGAGTTHIFHMAVGDQKCCGLMELFPDTSVELYTAKGYGNLARMLGFFHDRYVTERGNTRGDGSTVNVNQIKVQTTNILKKMIAKDGTCLHNVKDTRFPIFNPPFVF